MPVAFGVRKDYEDKWLPGVVAVNDASVDLSELLEAGEGQIVVPDDQTVLIQVLDEQLALKRVSVRTAEDSARNAAVKAAREEYGKLNADELHKRSEASKLGVAKSASKQDHVDALVAHVEANWTPEGVEA